MIAKISFAISPSLSRVVRVAKRVLVLLSGVYQSGIVVGMCITVARSLDRRSAKNPVSLQMTLFSEKGDPRRNRSLSLIESLSTIFLSVTPFKIMI